MRDDFVAGNGESAIELAGARHRDSLEQSNSCFRAVIMPLRFAGQLERSVDFDENTPSGGHFCLSEHLVRQDDEKQVGATVSRQAFELRSTEKPILQGRGFPENAPVTAMTDGIEVVRIIFREKRIPSAQGGVMNPQMFLQDIAPASERMKALACRRRFAIITSQIRQRLFAFKNRGNGLFAGA